MLHDNKILIAKSGEENIYIYPRMANRHGMIAGATGTGKTVTLKVMAESFSKAGVPVFLADVKGDLAAMCKKGSMNENVQKRVEKLGLEEIGYDFEAFPTNYWDIYAENGLPLRTTISEMGPLLLARILELNDVQSDILTVIFKIADDEEMLLLDTKDLRAMLQYVGENAKEYSLTYGNISKQSLAAIVRAVIALEAEGGDKFFGEPALDITDWLQKDMDGKGTIQVLDCQKLINNPTMYSTFLLWLMSELFETLPEAGDGEKPKMVFFFDEAHLLFSSASKALLNKIEQVVKLIRSKGVGIYFITQTPKDIPDGVLGQLGNKVQHALHAYTPAEQKGAKAAAESFRENPDFNTYETLLNLGTGEALISVLGEDGVPTIVQKGIILPPQSQMGVIDDDDREKQIKKSEFNSKYNKMIDRESAYEQLEDRIARQQAETAKAKEEAEAQKAKEKEEAAAQKAKEKEELAAQKAKEKEELAAQKAKEKEEAAKKKKKQRVVKNVASSVTGTIGREIGNEIGNSIGGSVGKKIGGNLGATLGRGILSTLFK